VGGSFLIKEVLKKRRAKRRVMGAVICNFDFLMRKAVTTRSLLNQVTLRSEIFPNACKHRQSPPQDKFVSKRKASTVLAELPPILLNQVLQIAHPMDPTTPNRGLLLYRRGLRYNRLLYHRLLLHQLTSHQRLQTMSKAFLLDDRIKEEEAGPVTWHRLDKLWLEG
jgi:hypothetical protein